MKQLNQKQQNMVAVAIGAVILVVVTWMFVIGPANSKKAKAKDDTAAIRDQIEKAQGLVAKKAKFEGDMEAVKAQLSEIEDQMATGDLFFWMNNTLETFKSDFNRQNGYKIDIPNVDREIRTKVGLIPAFPYEAALFRVSGTAFYHELGSFIAKFENQFPFMRIQNLELEPAISLDDEGAQRLAFKMEIVTLIKPVEGSEEEE